MFGKIQQQTKKNKFQTLLNKKDVIKEKHKNEQPKKQQKEDKFQQKIEKSIEKLKGSSFRLLNEMLYTSQSSEALKHFKQNPKDFLEYHAGYQSQVSKWPESPVETIIKIIEEGEIINVPNMIVCDLGCGDGQIYEHFEKHKSNNIQRVVSYDLYAHKPFIKVADIANLPRKANSAHMTIFSLSLMGKNYFQFLLEASRITKDKGYLVIAEVTSRLYDPNLFIMLVEIIGYKLLYQVNVISLIMKQNLNNNYFIILIFQKATLGHRITGDSTVTKSQIHLFGMKNQNVKTYSELSQQLLKPCYYKKR